jgi:hypothetical protein
MTVNSTARLRSSSRRLGEAEARIRMTGPSELAQRDGGDDDADDPDQLTFRLSPNVKARKRRSTLAGGVKPMIGTLGDQVVRQPGRITVPRSSPSREPTTSPATMTRTTSPTPRR